MTLIVVRASIYEVLNTRKELPPDPTVQGTTTLGRVYVYLTPHFHFVPFQNEQPSYAQWSKMNIPALERLRQGDGEFEGNPE